MAEKAEFRTWPTIRHWASVWSKTHHPFVEVLSVAAVTISLSLYPPACPRWPQMWPHHPALYIPANLNFFPKTFLSILAVDLTTSQVLLNFFAQLTFRSQLKTTSSGKYSLLARWSRSPYDILHHTLISCPHNTHLIFSFSPLPVHYFYECSNCGCLSHHCIPRALPNECNRSKAKKFFKLSGYTVLLNTTCKMWEALFPSSF